MSDRPIIPPEPIAGLTQFLFIFLTISLVAYGQIMLKWQLSRSGPLPEPFAEKIRAVSILLLNPWVLSCFAAAFLSAISWMVALSKMPLSTAYPLCSLSFVLVLILSNLFLHEPLNLYKILGVSLIVLGSAAIGIGSR